MTSPGEHTPITAPLRHRNFRALAAGRTLMYFGNGLATVALAFAVLDATGSPAPFCCAARARWRPEPRGCSPRACSSAPLRCR